MSYPTHPYEVEIHDQDGYADLIASYRTEAQAIESMPSHIAKARAEAVDHPADYAGCFFKLVKSVQDFQIFS